MNFLQHASDTYQVMAEDFLGGVEQLEHAFIAYGVVNIGALFARHDDIPVTQHGELLGSIGRLDGETLADLVDCQLPFTQCVKDQDSQGVGQCLEEFRFEIAELLSHPDSPITFSFYPFATRPHALTLSETIYDCESQKAPVFWVSIRLTTSVMPYRAPFLYSLPVPIMPFFV
jgi:hypothetical protein